eukprot:TRINITY_DN9456_c0_g1_i3.p1 TRINITY_DN9456_c0_g1~~TRINITY_DN9456_c0_g1_i3.p1  ORF type:complete len:252 (+),score=44.80 TRINITY_DN9456_c0_g1_i3:375-1130(+)
MRNRGDKITMVTAYDYPSAVHAERAGMDVVLVGDSLGMVQLGYPNTLPVSMSDMILHCKAVRRGTQRALVVGDLPFGSYQACLTQAQESAFRMVKEGGADCVKLEGGSEKRVRTVEAIVDSGVAVMGHIGLTPQAFSSLGGFRAQGKTAAQACDLVEQALSLEHAGASALVVECVPAEVAARISVAVGIPTIGIGAGPFTDGQVLVYHDLLGVMQNEPNTQCAVPRRSQGQRVSKCGVQSILHVTEAVGAV